MRFPDFGISSARIISKTKTYVSESASLKRHARTIGGQRWEISLTTVPLNEVENLQCFAFLAKQRGQMGVFSMIIPRYSSPTGALTHDVIVRRATQAGFDSVAIRNLPNAQARLLIPGDFIKFSGHQKVYQVQNMVDATASGQGEVQIYPALTSPVMAGEVCKCIDVEFSVSLTDDAYEFSIKGGEKSQLVIDVLEYI